MEISSDILAVREKCLWKFPAPDISTVPINVGEVSSEEKWRWKWLREKCLWKFPAPGISTVPINVGEVSSEEKWRWKFPATFWL